MLELIDDFTGIFVNVRVETVINLGAKALIYISKKYETKGN